MAKLVVSEFVTVDGVFEDPGGAEGMPYGGWAFDFDQGPQVFPTVIGQGKRLFDGLENSQALRLVSARPAGETVILTLVPRELA